MHAHMPSYWHAHHACMIHTCPVSPAYVPHIPHTPSCSCSSCSCFLLFSLQLYCGELATLPSFTPSTHVHHMPAHLYPHACRSTGHMRPLLPLVFFSSSFLSDVYE